MPIPNRFAELQAEITGWRHDLHAHPELLFDTHRTSALVAERLRAFGCDEVVEGIGRTGVVGVIRGRSTASGRVIALRADMDALPITEETGLPHASLTPGRMHACGHDGHTAMLLGAARYMAETRRFDGTVVLVFQPAEEGGGGGREMVEDGLMDRFGVQEVYGMHNQPGLPVGHFALRAGPIMASSDNFEIHVTGKGGHAARPQDCIDATVVASQIVLSLQTVVSRNVDPLKRVVLTIGIFESDSRSGAVIAQKVRLRGTVRTLDPEYRAIAEERVHRIVEGTALALGARAEVVWLPGYPVTVNSAAQARHAAETARAVAGVGCVEDDCEPMLAAEDFAYMLQERPGAFLFIGNGDSAQLHHPAYEFDDTALPYGAAWHAGIAEARMPLGVESAAV